MSGWKQRLSIKTIIVVGFCLTVFACTQQLSQPQNVTVTKAAVAMPDSYSADVAQAILQRGGIATIQWLKMYDLLSQESRNQGEAKLAHNSTAYVHLLAEIGKRVFADRAEYLGDPDFITVPVDSLIADDYLAMRSQSVSPNSISVTKKIKPILKESEQTTHFSILDKWGT